MTLAEIQRYINSYNRQKKIELQIKAKFDYTLADLVGASVGRIHNKSVTFPTIEEAYPWLYNDEEIIAKREEQKTNISVQRFMQFASNFNKRRGEQN